MLSRKSFLAYALALGLCSFSDTAFEMWSPAYLMRVYDLGSAVVGSRTGALEAIAGILGTLAGGLIADKLGSRDPRWYLWSPVVSVAALVPSVFLFLTVSVHFVFVFYFLAMFAAASYMGPVIGLTQRLMPVRMRALAASIQFLILNLLGPGAGVSFVGILNDQLASRYGALAIRYSMLASLGAAVAGVALFLYAARRLPADIHLSQNAAMKSNPIVLG
jgi:MFS family permease